MNCKEASKRLGPYLEGELPHDTMQLMVEHLEGCSTCKAKLSFLESIQTQIELEKKEAQPNPFLAQKVWNMAHSQEVPVIPLRRKAVVWIAAAGLAIGLALGSLVENGNFYGTDQAWEQLANDYFPTDFLSPYDNLTGNQ